MKVAYQIAFLVKDPAKVRQALGSLAELGYTGLNPEDLGRLVQDPYEEELTVMADVLAYFQVAYKVRYITSTIEKFETSFLKRIIDEVPRIIEINLNEALGNSLQDWLLNELQIEAPDATQRFKSLISQDLTITFKRSQLESDIAKLEKIKKELRNLGFYSDGGSSSANLAGAQGRTKAAQRTLFPFLQR